MTVKYKTSTEQTARPDVPFHIREAADLVRIVLKRALSTSAASAAQGESVEWLEEG